MNKTFFVNYGVEIDVSTAKRVRNFKNYVGVSVMVEV